MRLYHCSLECRKGLYRLVHTCLYFNHSVTDVLWITPTLFAAVYSSFEDGDCPKFLLISTPVSHLHSLQCIISTCSKSLTA